MNVVYTGEYLYRFAEMLAEQNIPHTSVSVSPDGTTVEYAEAGHLTAINTAKAGYAAWLTAVEAQEAAFASANVTNLNSTPTWLTEGDTDYSDADTAKTASTTAATAATGSVSATNTAQTAAQTDANGINVLTTLLTDANGFIKRATQRQADALTRESAALTREAATLTRIAALEDRNRRANRRVKGLIQLVRQLKGKTR